jgi:hypothetical protein
MFAAVNQQKSLTVVVMFNTLMQWGMRMAGNTHSTAHAGTGGNMTCLGTDYPVLDRPVLHEMNSNPTLERFVCRFK